MKGSYKIEFVYTGNGGRSPQAETIAKDYNRRKVGILSPIEICSSGTHAKITEEDLFQMPVNFLLDYIKIGLNSGTYKGKAVEVAEEITAAQEKFASALQEENPHSRNKINAKDKIEYCIRYLCVDEVAKRNNVLLEVGMVPEGHFHQQTVVRDDVDLILAMKQSNADTVKELYKGERTRPEIATLCEYAGIKGEISDPFAGSIEAFRRTRDKIAEVVEKSIDKVLEKEFHWSNNWVLNP